MIVKGKFEKGSEAYYMETTGSKGYTIVNWRDVREYVGGYIKKIVYRKI